MCHLFLVSGFWWETCCYSSCFASRGNGSFPSACLRWSSLALVCSLTMMYLGAHFFEFGVHSVFSVCWFMLFCQIHEIISPFSWNIFSVPPSLPGTPMTWQLDIFCCYSLTYLQSSVHFLQCFLFFRLGNFCCFSSKFMYSFLCPLHCCWIHPQSFLNILFFSSKVPFHLVFISSLHRYFLFSHVSSMLKIAQVFLWCLISNISQIF